MSSHHTESGAETSGQLYLVGVNIGGKLGKILVPQCKILTRPSWPSGVMKGPSRAQ